MYPTYKRAELEILAPLAPSLYRVTKQAGGPNAKSIFNWFKTGKARNFAKNLLVNTFGQSPEKAEKLIGDFEKRVGWMVPKNVGKYVNQVDEFVKTPKGKAVAGGVLGGLAAFGALFGPRLLRGAEKAYTLKELKNTAKAFAKPGVIGLGGLGVGLGIGAAMHSRRNSNQNAMF